MAGPPKDIEPNELWEALSSMERATRRVRFPRNDVEGKPLDLWLRLRVLTQGEQTSSAVAAEKSAREFVKQGKRGDLGYERVYADCLMVETLFRAARQDAEVMRPAFPTQQHMMTELTTEELAMLFSHYLTVQLELGPTAHSMDPSEMEAWIDRLVEGGSANPSNLLSSEQQQILLLYTCFQYRSCQKDSSSASKRPEESMTGEWPAEIPALE